MSYFGLFVGSALVFVAFLFLVAFYIDWIARQEEVIYMNRPDLEFQFERTRQAEFQNSGTDIRRPKFGIREEKRNEHS